MKQRHYHYTLTYWVYLELEELYPHHMRFMPNFYPVKNGQNIYPGYVSLGLLVEFMQLEWLGPLFQIVDGALLMVVNTRLEFRQNAPN